jgi:hypothetical protein
VPSGTLITLKGHNQLRLVDSKMQVVSPVIDVWAH